MTDITSVESNRGGKRKKTTGQLGLQVTDISQYGDIAAAQSVLVPAGAKVLDKSTTKVQQPPRNTGTLAGVFQAPPTTVYRYCPTAECHITVTCLDLLLCQHHSLGQQLQQLFSCCLYSARPSEPDCSQ